MLSYSRLSLLRVMLWHPDGDSSIYICLTSNLLDAGLADSTLQVVIMI